LCKKKKEKEKTRKTGRKKVEEERKKFGRTSNIFERRKKRKQNKTAWSEKAALRPPFLRLLRSCPRRGEEEAVF
jgi:hypothetical protein